MKELEKTNDVHDKGDAKRVEFSKSKGVEGWLLTSHTKIRKFVA